MKTISIISSFLLFLFGINGQIIAQIPVYNEEVLLTGNILNLDKNELNLQFVLKNKSSESIYVSANPVRVLGEKGYYLSLDNATNSVLEISSRVFQPPLYSVYRNYTRVQLKELKPNEEMKENISLKSPVMETDPPFEGSAIYNRKIAFKELKRIRLIIGYFFKEEGILDILKVKPFGPYVTGWDPVFSGKYKDKSLLEAQNLASILIPAPSVESSSDNSVILCKICTK